MNLKNINKKIVAYLSLFGFILSFISGIISGNNFINIFIRSIFSGMIIGLLIVLINIVIMIYLPELLENSAEEELDDLDSDGQVDIVMPEESYQVQVDDETMEDENSNGDSSSVSGFNEVGFNNLKSLSTSDVSGDSGNSGSGGFDDEENFSLESSSKASEELGKHSIDEMARAVKTVLKKD